MELLVVGTDESEVAGAAADLRRAGHRTWRCHDGDRPAFPCHELENPGTCPLDLVPVDVVVTVRTTPGDQPTPGEGGATCALRRGVPLVAAGDATANPFAPWASAVVGDDDDLAEVCERTAQAPVVELGDLAARALADSLVVHGYRDVASSARVTRSGGTLAVRLRADAEVDAATCAAAATRACGAVRARDRHARGVTVSFEP